MDSYKIRFKQYISDSGYSIKIDLELFKELITEVKGFAFIDEKTDRKVYYLSLDGYKLALTSKMVQVLDELGCRDITEILDDLVTLPLLEDVNDYDTTNIGIGNKESLRRYLKDAIFSFENDL